MPDTHDAVVVGGGPAGAVTALLLARANRRVALVEREAFPRAKPCGDCLSAAATGLLEELGLLAQVRRAGAARIDRWRIVAPSGHACTGRFDDDTYALALERRVLDDVLLRAALLAGARLIAGRVHDLVRDQAGAVTGVLLRPEDGAPAAVTARLVVGADGLRSVVARRADLVRRRPRLRKVSLTVHGRGPAGALGHGEMHVLESACFGLAPAGRGRFNATLVVGEEESAALADLGPQAFFRRWLERAPAVLRYLEEAELDEDVLASGPFDWPTRSPVAPGLALVGDAAGYYDPFTGQGVFQAMESAHLLARAVEGVDLRDPDARAAALRRYARALRRLKGSARRVQRVVEAALASPARADFVLGRLARAPAVMDRLVEVTGDVRPARALLSPSLLSSLVFSPAPEVR